MSVQKCPCYLFEYPKCHSKSKTPKPRRTHCVTVSDLGVLAFQGREREREREMGRRILNDALRSIVNAEKRGKATVELKPISNVISSFLKIMKDRGKSVLFLSLPIWVFFIVLLFFIASIKFSHLYFWIPLLFEIVVGLY